MVWMAEIIFTPFLPKRFPEVTRGGWEKQMEFTTCMLMLWIVINPMRSGCCGFEGMCCAQNEKASQLTQRLKSHRLKFRE